MAMRHRLGTWRAVTLLQVACRCQKSHQRALFSRLNPAECAEVMREYGPEGGRNLLLHLESEEHAKGQGLERLSEIPLYAHIKVRGAEREREA